MSKDREIRLAQIIRKYWQKRGFEVAIKIVSVILPKPLKANLGGNPVYSLKSDMLNGLPARALRPPLSR